MYFHTKYRRNESDIVETEELPGVMQKMVERNPLAPAEKVATATVKMMSNDYQKRKNKSKLPDGISAIDSSQYYREKRLDLDISINPLLSSKKYAQHNEKTIEKVVEYAAKYLESGPKVETKSGVVEMSEFMRHKRTTLAGSKVMFGGHETKEFEWSNRSINNRLYAFFNRQLGSQQRYDDKCLEDFLKFITPFCKERAEQFNSLYDHEQSLLDYPDRQDNWPKHKKDLYRKNILKAFHDTEYNDYNGSFIMQAKSGEVHHTFGSLEEDADGYTVGQDSRPRNICAPTDEGYGILQAVQSTLWVTLKKVFPEFIHSMTKEEFKKHLEKRVKNRMVNISWDGSSWDSSQFP